MWIKPYKGVAFKKKKNIVYLNTYISWFSKKPFI